jgi:cytochrome c-type biogenesis protein CcmH/NrfG
MGRLFCDQNYEKSLHPQSGNAYDSLAEAYMDEGDKAEAIANYEKSLQLNPKNDNAFKTLQRLKAP